jgi:hypothetical protein
MGLSLLQQPEKLAPLQATAKIQELATRSFVSKNNDSPQREDFDSF